MSAANPAHVAVVAYAADVHPGGTAAAEPALVHRAVTAVLGQAGIDRSDIGFTCSGSFDYLAGAPFSFVGALDSLGAWPPISESHVEMDAAWALYEAWLHLLGAEEGSGIALAYGFGKPTQGSLPDILARTLDPYYLAPLGVDADDLAALQARAAVDAGVCTEEAAGAAGAPPADGAAAVLLATEPAASRIARARGVRPAWITGLEHRIDMHSPACRDLARCASAEQAAAAAGVDKGPVHVAELHARHLHEEALLRAALGLGPETEVNPSGGPLAADPVMATGLVRIGEAARRVADGTADRAAAHAAQGPCLQHNLVAVLEAAPEGGPR
ncbi:lipid-transfer protein [Nocardiopsis suaedae]|uniref:Lipid-transfer protein n=1 Tax=Nocardiopsis suaedae TaxID=3018444 RepID=A0ABT4TSJ0_9ACTN|nr:lipid-transfer protein [Nocardiopsis suaedae]MDA2807646.1 lipid-transfer protein [Nocardiopsis suaedae]